MQITEEMLYNGLSRLWHVVLLVASAYVAGNPKYAWAIPIFQGLGSVVTFK